MNTAIHAWLETPNGERLPLDGTCSIGRDAVNSLVVTGEKVSRRHALIHSQNSSEYWLVDLGSRNGTFRNSRPIKQPTQLQNGDSVGIGSVQFTLRIDPLPSRQQTPASQTASAETISTQRASNVWLLIVDVVNFTALTQKLAPDELTRQLGAWLLLCADLVEKSGGCVDKYVGDGFLAYWEQSTAASDQLATALKAFTQLQNEGSFPFRWILHNANLQLGISRFRNESLVGKEINFTYRMEKIAGGLQLPRLLSKPAAETLPKTMASRAVGVHPVKGFEGEFEFFTV